MHSAHALVFDLFKQFTTYTRPTPRRRIISLDMVARVQTGATLNAVSSRMHKKAENGTPSLHWLLSGLSSCPDALFLTGCCFQEQTVPVCRTYGITGHCRTCWRADQDGGMELNAWTKTWCTPPGVTWGRQLLWLRGMWLSVVIFIDCGIYRFM